MRSLLAAAVAAVVAAVAFVPAAQAAPEDCLDGPRLRAPEYVTRDEQGRIIVDPSAGDPHVQALVDVVLCLT